MSFSTTPSSAYLDTTLDSPGNLYQKIRKIDNMNEMANFLLDHVKNVPKYDRAICEAINKITEYNHDVHIEAVRALVKEALDCYDLVFKIPQDQNGYIQNDYKMNILAYINVLKTYADWLFKGATGKIICVYPAVSGNRYCVKKGLNHYDPNSRMTTLVNETYIPMLLLMTSPSMIDKYCEIDPYMKRSILHLICGDRLVDDNCYIIDHDRVIDNLGNILPNVSRIVGDPKINIREEMADQIIDMAKSNYVDVDEGVRCTIDGIDSYSGILISLFRTADDNDIINSNCNIFYDANYAFERGMEIDLAEALGTKYYGADANIIYQEVPYIYHNVSLSDDNWKLHADTIVKRLITYSRLLTKTYLDSNDKINDAIVRTALRSIKNRDHIYEYVIKEFDKRCNEFKDLDPDDVAVIGRHRWIFEDKIVPYEEEIEEDGAIESKISRRAARTVKLDKFARKSYNKYKDFDDRVNQADSTLTKWAHSLKNMVMGDTRSEIIEGKNYTVLGVFRRIFTDAAIWSFFGPVKGVIALITKHALKKKTTNKERKAIVRELESEIAICETKIDHAQSDGKRKEVYQLMRIKGELEEARDRIADGIGAAYNVSSFIKSTLKNRKGAIK